MEAAPRVDADHFGFPGTVEDDEDGIEDASLEDSDERGARRGRKAFISIGRLLESVQMKEESLMGWVVEMVHSSI